jgi:hypothetical protein
MAIFCTKCGAPLASPAGFCAACGAPVGRAAVTAAYAPVRPTLANRPLKILLIVIAVAVGLGALAVGGIALMAHRASRSIRIDRKGDGMSVSVPGAGSVSLGDSTASEADLGVPIYPGAVNRQAGCG